MGDIIVLGIIILLVGAASFYIWKSKKNGAKCIGCPSCKSCSGSCGSEKSKQDE